MADQINAQQEPYGQAGETQAMAAQVSAQGPAGTAEPTDAATVAAAQAAAADAGSGMGYESTVDTTGVLRPKAVMGPGNGDAIVWMFGDDLNGFNLNFTWGFYSGTGKWHRPGEGHMHPEEEALVFVGLDTDAALTLPDIKGCVVVSVLKRFDVAAREAILRYSARAALPASIMFDVAVGGISLTTIARPVPAGFADRLAGVLAAMRDGPPRPTPAPASRAVASPAA